MHSLSLRRRAWRIALAAAFLLAPVPLAAQASPNVPLADPAYGDIDRLIHEGVLDSVIVGHRPFTRAEFRRLADVAARRQEGSQERLRGSGERAYTLVGKADTVSAARRDAVDWITRRLQERFGLPSSLAIDHYMLDAFALGSASRGIADNGLGRIVAALNPLAEGRQGRPIADGVTSSAAVGVHAQAGVLAGSAAVRHSALRRRAGSWQARTEVEQLYVTLALGNLLVQAGRDQVALATGSTGLLVSGNAPALDMIKLSTSRPFVMPWVLRHLGPTRLTVFASDLGSGRVPNHDWLAGYRASILPHRNLELGLTVGSQQGGSGSTTATPLERVVDLFPLIDVLFMQDGDLEISDKYSGIDFRWRMPGARALELYGDLLLDDFDHRRLIGTFRDDAAIAAGVVIPRLTADGRWQASAEYQRTGIRFYTHGEFRHGLTRRGFILGNPLGPDANAGTVQVRFAPDMRRDITLGLIHERRSGDHYMSTGGYGDETLRFVTVDTLPKEGRTRGTVRVNVPAYREWTRVVVEGGVERVRNFAFTGGDDRTNALVRVALEARF